MAYYISQPTVIREVQGLVISQSGDQAQVNGSPASMITAADILSNERHYLRVILRSAMHRLESGEVAAVVLAPVNGKDAQIMITAAQYALGEPERARHAAWLSEVMSQKTQREEKEHAYDLANNEGREGYNPHRSTSERTYARAPRRERDYPEGA